MAVVAETFLAFPYVYLRNTEDLLHKHVEWDYATQTFCKILQESSLVGMFWGE